MQEESSSLSLVKVLLREYVLLVGVILAEELIVVAELDVLDLEAEWTVDAVGEGNVHASDAIQGHPMLLTGTKRVNVIYYIVELPTR